MRSWETATRWKTGRTSRSKAPAPSELGLPHQLPLERSWWSTRRSSQCQKPKYQHCFPHSGLLGTSPAGHRTRSPHAAHPSHSPDRGSSSITCGPGAPHHPGQHPACPHAAARPRQHPQPPAGTPGAGPRAPSPPAACAGGTWELWGAPWLRAPQFLFSSKLPDLAERRNWGREQAPASGDCPGRHCPGAGRAGGEAQLRNARLRSDTRHPVGLGHSQGATLPLRRVPGLCGLLTCCVTSPEPSSFSHQALPLLWVLGRGSPAGTPHCSTVTSAAGPSPSPLQPPQTT